MPEEYPTNPEVPAEQWCSNHDDLVPLIERVARTMVDTTVEADQESITEPSRPPSIKEQRIEILETCPDMHPLLPAERGSAAIIRRFYGLPKNKPSVVAWRGIDVLLSKGEGEVGRQVEAIRAELDEAYAAGLPLRRRMGRVRIGATQPGEAEWSDIAKLRASLPALTDRMAARPVSQESAAFAYRTIVKQLMPFVQDGGIFSEAIAMALLAHQGGTSFAFPGSLREESAILKNSEDQLYNHDIYQLTTPGLIKTPLQVKTKQTNNDPTLYDPGVVQVYMLDWLAPVVLGPGVVVHDSVRFLEYMRNIFLIPTSQGQAILDVAAKYFSDRIHEQAVLQGIRPA